jgi:hypothetical protein
LFFQFYYNIFIFGFFKTPPQTTPPPPPLVLSSEKRFAFFCCNALPFLQYVCNMHINL